jgi:NAD kinase
MNRLTENKIVLVTRPTRLAELVVRFNTVSQARFYIEHQGADFADYLHEDETYHHALRDTQTVLAQAGRVQIVDRTFLPNFVFAPDDLVVTLGQDGLVANTIKYLNGQQVIGVNPDPARWDGKLLPFKVADLGKIVPEVFAHRRPTKSVTMAKASLNNGQTMYAVNDLFIGFKSHGSARYSIRSGEASETHSSSGVIISTGLGSTGWLKSLLTGAAAITRAAALPLPFRTGEGRGEGSLVQSAVQKSKTRNPHTSVGVKSEFAWDANYLFFTVREPFPTRTTGASLVFGRVTPETSLILESQMAENGIIFSDGIEKDFLEFNSGTRATIGLAERKGVLVV